MVKIFSHFHLHLLYNKETNGTFSCQSNTGTIIWGLLCMQGVLFMYAVYTSCYEGHAFVFYICVYPRRVAALLECWYNSACKPVSLDFQLKPNYSVVTVVFVKIKISFILHGCLPFSVNFLDNIFLANIYKRFLM